MINYCLKKWQQNNGKLRKYIQNNADLFKDSEYSDLVQVCSDIILNGKDRYSRRSTANNSIEWDTQGIKQFCANGGNCSMSFFLIPRNSFDNAPTERDCLLTFAYKDGNRDALKNWQKKYSHDNGQSETEDLFHICYSIIERTVCPYDAGLV